MAEMVVYTASNKVGKSAYYDYEFLQEMVGKITGRLIFIHARESTWDATIDGLSDEQKKLVIAKSSVAIRHIKQPTEEMKRLHALRWKI